MPDSKQDTWMPLQRDFPSAELAEQKITFQLQVKGKDGRWVDWGVPKADRDEMTRTQAFCLREDPNERQRVLRLVNRIYIDEIIGDDKDGGETPVEELMARNDQVTQELLAQEKDQ